LEKKKVVADASAIVKWFVEEDSSDAARRMRDSFVTGKLAISIPSLLFYEALNALWQSGLYREEELVLLARSLSKYGFDVHEPRGKIYEQSATLSSRQDISIYDATYVSLALQLRATLFTADSELIEKFPEATKHIGSFELSES